MRPLNYLEALFTLEYTLHTESSINMRPLNYLEAPFTLEYKLHPEVSVILNHLYT